MSGITIIGTMTTKQMLFARRRDEELKLNVFFLFFFSYREKEKMFHLVHLLPWHEYHELYLEIVQLVEEHDRNREF